MALVRINQFGGRVPKLSDRFIGQSAASIATNCKLWSKTLKPWNNPLLVDTNKRNGTLHSIYLYDNSSWFQWEDEVDVERSQIAGTSTDDPVPFDRTYFTGVGRPQVTDSSIATAGGGTQFPANSYDLGIPRPDTPPAVTAPVHPPDLYVDDNGDPILDSVGQEQFIDPVIEASKYVYTFVRIWNGVESEGRPSPVSSLVNVTPGDPVTVSGMAVTMPLTEPGVPSWDSNVTHKRIYRVATAFEGAEFEFVGQVALAIDSYVDTKLSDELGEVLATTTWNPPPDDLHSLVAMPNGMMAGLSGNRLCFCEPYQPHAWPIDYRLSVTYLGVGLAVYGQTVCVATIGQPSIASGVDPAYVTMEKLDIRQACVSKQSIADMGDYIIYASPDGLVAFGSGVRQLLTPDFFYKEDWQKYNPESMRAFNYDGYYICFYDNGTTQAGFIFDPRDPAIGFVDIELFATAGYSHLESDLLYLVVNDEIVAWDASTTKMVYEWKSGEIIAPEPVNPAVCQIFAKGYPFAFKLFADGVERYTGTVVNNKEFRLPGGYLATDFQAYFQGNTEIEDMFIGETSLDLKRA